jgi:hypothetical protein
MALSDKIHAKMAPLNEKPRWSGCNAVYVKVKFSRTFYVVPSQGVTAHPWLQLHKGARFITNGCFDVLAAFLPVKYATIRTL